MPRSGGAERWSDASRPRCSGRGAASPRRRWILPVQVSTPATACKRGPASRSKALIRAEPNEMRVRPPLPQEAERHVGEAGGEPVSRVEASPRRSGRAGSPEAAGDVDEQHQEPARRARANRRRCRGSARRPATARWRARGGAGWRDAAPCGARRAGGGTSRRQREAGAAPARRHPGTGGSTGSRARRSTRRERGAPGDPDHQQRVESRWFRGRRTPGSPSSAA